MNNRIMIKYFRPALLLSAMLACTALPSSAQGTVEDYNRAYSLREKYSQSHVLYADVEPHWIENTDSFWYIRNTERGREYALVDARGARLTDLFNHEQLAERLSAMSGKKVEPYRIYILTKCARTGLRRTCDLSSTAIDGLTTRRKTRSRREATCMLPHRNATGWRWTTRNRAAP